MIIYNNAYNVFLSEIANQREMQISYKKVITKNRPLLETAKLIYCFKTVAVAFLKQQTLYWLWKTEENNTQILFLKNVTLVNGDR
jgi:hypothetical protein